MRLTPVRLIIIGMLLMVFAAVATFLMALRWIYPTLLLNFVAVMASVVGSTLGFYGLFTKTHPKARSLKSARRNVNFTGTNGELVVRTRFFFCSSLKWGCAASSTSLHVGDSFPMRADCSNVGDSSCRSKYAQAAQIPAAGVDPKELCRGERLQSATGDGSSIAHPLSALAAREARWRPP